MKITGTRSYIDFDLENGNIIRADGELLINKQFVVYINSMRYIQKKDAPDNIQITIDRIIKEVSAISNENTMKIIFE